MARRRAAAGRALHRGRRGPAGLRRLVPAAGGRGPRAARQARARRRPVAAMAELGHDRVRRRRPRPRRPRRLPDGARPSRDASTRLAVLDIVPTGEIWCARRRPLRARLLALGVPRPAGAAARAPDRSATPTASGSPRGAWASGGRPALPRRGRRRLPARSSRPRDRRGDLRGLPGRRDDRPRARRRRPRRADHRLPGARAVGRARARCRSSTTTRSSSGAPYAPDVTGRAIEGASHFLVEDAPEEVASDLAAFFTA